MVGETLALFGSGAAGGVIGIIGSLVGVASKWLMKREERRSRKDEIEYELALIEAQMKQAGRAFEHELAIMAESGRTEVRSQAIQAESKLSGSYKWVEAIRALFRPFLTVFLWIMAAYFFHEIQTATITSPIMLSIANDVMFAAGSSTGFWFGDRSFTPKHER